MLAEQHNDEKIVMECLIVETGSVLGNVVTIIGAAKNALALTGINFLSSKVTDLCENGTKGMTWCSKSFTWTEIKKIKKQ